MKKINLFFIVFLLILKTGIISAQIFDPLNIFKQTSVKYFRSLALETKQLEYYNEEKYAKNFIFVIKVVELNEQSGIISFAIKSIRNLSYYDEINPFTYFEVDNRIVIITGAYKDVLIKEFGFPLITETKEKEIKSYLFDDTHPLAYCMHWYISAIVLIDGGALTKMVYYYNSWKVPMEYRIPEYENFEYKEISTKKFLNDSVKINSLDTMLYKTIKWIPDSIP